MKLETIKTAIREWNELNDYSEEASFLLNQGVLFKINPKVLECSSRAKSEEKIYVHAYPGVMEGELKFFLINSYMDKKEHFEDKNIPISNYIFVADLEEMNENFLSDFDETESGRDDNINPLTAKERILNWNLSKNSWIKNQINNTEGIFEAFIIPISDLQPDCDIYALLALADGKNIKGKKEHTADLIIWDKKENHFRSNPESGLYDLVRPVPPFGDDYSDREYNPLIKKNFYLLNISNSK